MARITQVGPGRKTSGTLDGVTYVTTRNGNTYARVKGVLPAYVTKTPAALKRQSIFKMVQEYANFHLRTLKQTITRKGQRHRDQPFHPPQLQGLRCRARRTGRPHGGWRGGDPR